MNLQEVSIYGRSYPICQPVDDYEPGAPSLLLSSDAYEEEPKEKVEGNAPMPICLPEPSYQMVPYSHPDLLVREDVSTQLESAEGCDCKAALTKAYDFLATTMSAARSTVYNIHSSIDYQDVAVKASGVTVGIALGVLGFLPSLTAFIATLGIGAFLYVGSFIAEMGFGKKEFAALYGCFLLGSQIGLVLALTVSTAKIAFVAGAAILASAAFLGYGIYANEEMSTKVKAMFMQLKAGAESVATKVGAAANVAFTKLGKVADVVGTKLEAGFNVVVTAFEAGMDVLLSPLDELFE